MGYRPLGDKQDRKKQVARNYVLLNLCSKLGTFVTTGIPSVESNPSACRFLLRLIAANKHTVICERSSGLRQVLFATLTGLNVSYPRLVNPERVTVYEGTIQEYLHLHSAWDWGDRFSGVWADLEGNFHVKDDKLFREIMPYCSTGLLLTWAPGIMRYSPETVSCPRFFESPRWKRVSRLKYERAYYNGRHGKTLMHEVCLEPLRAV